MRVRLAILFGEGEVEDVILLGEGDRSQLHQLGAVGHIGLRHGQCGIFQLQTVDEHNIRVAQESGNGRRRFEGVRVGSLRHDAPHIDTVAAHSRHDRGDRGNGGGDENRVAIRLRRGVVGPSTPGQHEGGGGNAGDDNGKRTHTKSLWRRPRSCKRLALSVRRSILAARRVP